MIRIIGNGGHAAVVRDVIRMRGGDSLRDYFFVAIGDNRTRKKVAEAEAGEPCFPLVHSRAYVADTASIGDGSVVMAGAVIQPRARIGKHVIVNSGAVVDHDCIVEDYAHVAPGAHLCGNVHVGEGALVGVGVGIAPGARIPAWHLVKARKLEIEPVPSHC